MLLLHLATFSAFDDKFLICPNRYSILLVVCIELYYTIFGSPLIKYASVVQIVLFQTTWLIIFIKSINFSANTSRTYLLWIFMQLHKFSQSSWLSSFSTWIFTDLWLKMCYYFNWHKEVADFVKCFKDVKGLFMYRGKE